MTGDPVTVAISGKAFHAALDPKTSGVPGEEGWPAPTFRKAGKGVQAVYELNRAHAESMEHHLRDVGEGFMAGDDPGTRAEGRACVAAADRIAVILEGNES